MPFALVLIGLVLIVTSAQDSYVQMGSQIKKDFTGTGSFMWWLVAIMMVGAIGYVQKLKPLSIALMTLVLIVLLLKNGNFFAQLTSALQKAPVKPAVGAEGATPSIPSQVATAVTGSAATLGGTSTGLATALQSGNLGDAFSAAAKSIIGLPGL